MPITPLPTPAPTRNQTQAAFDAAYAAHIAALPTFVTEANALIAEYVAAQVSPVNFKRITVASAATTADIWTGLGNQINWTGTTTCTGFPAAPQAGVERVLVCAGAAPFTAGANMLIDGVASGNTVTCAANDIMIVRAVTTTQFRLSRVKYDGTAQVGGALVLLSTVAAANSATIDVETGFGSTYDDYIIIADGVRPTTDNATMRGQLKIGGSYLATSTYYFHIALLSDATAVYGSARSSGVTYFEVSPGLDNVSAVSNHAFTMDVQNVNDTALGKSATLRGTAIDVSAPSYQTIMGSVSNSTAGALSGVRFFMGAGNISVGTFRLYGVQK